jgi:hypothetical protein
MADRRLGCPSNVPAMDMLLLLPSGVTAAPRSEVFLLLLLPMLLLLTTFEQLSWT